jgi:hypothetical protein
LAGVGSTFATGAGSTAGGSTAGGSTAGGVGGVGAGSLGGGATFAAAGSTFAGFATATGVSARLLCHQYAAPPPIASAPNAATKNSVLRPRFGGALGSLAVVEWKVSCVAASLSPIISR